jgi:gliotoxin/aspirochlorine biosynthesis thioredoxin reductase
MSSPSPSNQAIRDVFIIGGSYAGLSTATTLYRANHTITIFDSHNYRSTLSPITRQLPSWEGQDAAEYRAKTRSELFLTGLVEFEDVAITAVKKMEDGLWQLTDINEREWLGRKIVLATGVEDVFPDIKGYTDCWVSGM